MNYNLTLSKQIKSITDILKQHALTIDKLASVAGEFLDQIDDRYTPAAQIAEREKIQLAAYERAAEARAHATSELRIAFSSLKATVAQWAAQAIPPEVMNLVAGYQSVGLIPSVTELKILREAYPDNYFSQRMISEMARKEHQTFFPEVTIDEVLKHVKATESECMNIVEAYSGQPDGNKLPSSWISDAEIIQQGFAADYLDKERTQLTDLAKELDAITNPQADLLLSERDRIDVYFEGVKKKDRIDKMIELLQNHSEMENTLFGYDNDLYLAAVEKISDEKKKEAAAAQVKAEKASRQAKDLKIEAARSSANFARADKIISNMAKHNALNAAR